MFSNIYSTSLKTLNEFDLQSFLTQSVLDCGGWRLFVVYVFSPDETSDLGIIIENLYLWRKIISFNLVQTLLLFLGRYIFCLFKLLIKLFFCLIDRNLNCMVFYHISNFSGHIHIIRTHSCSHMRKVRLMQPKTARLCQKIRIFENYPHMRKNRTGFSSALKKLTDMRFITAYVQKLADK